MLSILPTRFALLLLKSVQGQSICFRLFSFQCYVIIYVLSYLHFTELTLLLLKAYCWFFENKIYLTMHVYFEILLIRSDNTALKELDFEKPLLNQPV